MKTIIGAIALLLIASLWPLSSQGSDPAELEIFLTTGSCPGCDLSGAFLDAVVAEGGDLWNTNLRGASLYRAKLSQANLSGADLTGANLMRVSLYGADLTGAILAQAKTTGAFTDTTTTCPDGSAGPCMLSGGN